MVRTCLTILMLLALGSQLVLGNTGDEDSKTTSWPLEIAEYQVSLVNLVKLNSASLNPMADNSAIDKQQLLLNIKCKNTSAKPINLIQQESRFTDTAKNLVVKQFKSKKKIKPGKEEVCEELLPYNMNMIPSTVTIGFRIMKIEYNDNSTWEECTQDTDACVVYKTYHIGGE